MEEGDSHPDKPKSACAMLNKLFLVAAIVCFALFLASIAYIVANLEGVSSIKLSFCLFDHWRMWMCAYISIYTHIPTHIQMLSIVKMYLYVLRKD